MSGLRNRRGWTGVAAVLSLMALTAGGALTAAAQERDDDSLDDVVYATLGRGYAAVIGYPADEVPSGGDDEEEEPPPKPPAQTCPEDQRGVPETLQARLQHLQAADRLSPVEPGDQEVPTPRGQPIKFDVGLADASLRSDPGSHAIAAFFYVDLGGAQEPWTSAEADGYAAGHAREEERCGRPYARKPGQASDVHVIARATEGPYAFAFHHATRPILPGGITFEEAVTVTEMTGRQAPVVATVTTIVKGVVAGPLRADEIVTVLRYETDGTDAGTHLLASTDVTGLVAAGTPLEVAPGAPPVAVGDLLVGLHAPEVRERPNGTTEVTAGGLYVAGEFPNPVGAQAKQAAYLGGAWLDVSTSTLPPLPAPPALPAGGADASAGTSAGTSSGGPLGTSGGSGFSQAPVAGTAQPPAQQPAAPVVSQPASDAAGLPPAALAASRRLGVYRAPPHVVGPVLIALGFLGSLWLGLFVWARHRYPEVRAVLGIPMFRWLDASYRAFLRG